MLVENMMGDLKQIRELLPVTNEYVYLDNGSMGPLPVPVCQAIKEFHMDRSHHGRNFSAWWLKVDQMRQRIAEIIDLPERETVHAILNNNGIITALRDNGIRISPFYYNTFTEIDCLI